MIILNWSNGGMGNAIYIMLCFCTNEINQTVALCDLPLDGKHWHTISRSIKTNKIIKSHPEIKQNAVKIGSRNFYLLKLMSWAKWEGYPVINTADELELLHLFLNKWKPSITNPDFEITKLFDIDANIYVKNFIKKLGFTPNKNVDIIIKYIVKNNEVYYNKIKYLEQITQDVIDEKYTSINVLEKHEQALLMTMVYKQTHMPFKLIHNTFENTKDIWDNMEITNAKTI